MTPETIIFCRKISWISWFCTTYKTKIIWGFWYWWSMDWETIYYLEWTTLRKGRNKRDNICLDAIIWGWILHMYKLKIIFGRLGHFWIPIVSLSILLKAQRDKIRYFMRNWRIVARFYWRNRIKEQFFTQSWVVLGWV